MTPTHAEEVGRPPDLSEHIHHRADAINVPLSDDEAPS